MLINNYFFFVNNFKRKRAVLLIINVFLNAIFMCTFSLRTDVDVGNLLTGLFECSIVTVTT